MKEFLLKMLWLLVSVLITAVVDVILVQIFNITGFYTMLLLFSVVDFVVLLPIYFYGENRIERTY